MNHFYAKAFLFIAGLMASNTIQAQSLNWSSEINVAMGSMYGNVRPRLAITAGNVPVVMWGGGMCTEPLYVARWNGTGFGTPVQITPNIVDPFVMNWGGPDIAASDNTVFAVFKRQPEMMNYIYIVKSTDGGITWSDTTRVETMTGAYARFPSLAVTSSGNPAVMFMTFNSSWGNAEYVVANSIDGGQTFQMPVNVSAAASAEVCDCCPGYIEIQGNTQVASFRRNNNNMRDMWASVSTNSGVTFPTTMDVDNTNWMINSCPSSGPDPYLWNDSLYTVFMSGSTGDNRIILNTRNISTQQNGFTSMLAGAVPSNSSQNYPFIAGNADTLAVVWQQNDNGNVNTYYSWSINGAAGLINNQSILNNNIMNTQENPHVAFSNGTFHFVFTDGMTGNVIYKKATINPTGISEQENEQTISVAPNPFSDHATVKFSNPEKTVVEANLYDISGKLVRTFNTTANRLIIDRGSLDAGIYFLTVSDETGVLSRAKLLVR
jgi:hypothetical protein